MNLRLIFVLVVIDIYATKGNDWWHCKSNVCKKYHKPSKYSSKQIWEKSLEICRLTCGKYGALWPQSTGLTSIGKSTMTFNLNPIPFNFHGAKNGTEEYLVKITNIFFQNLQLECGTNCTKISNAYLNISINVETDDLKLRNGIDEAYSLNVYTTKNNAPQYNIPTSIQVSIESKTVFGARNALETLSQLITFFKTETGAHGLMIATVVTIEDRPKFKHRGLLIDTARNYMAVKSLKRQLDAMAASKMNVFHWHMTDSQSFPLELNTQKFLSIKGAFSAEQVYTTQDVKDIKEYALLRGIRLIVEVDIPSHLGYGWQWGSRVKLIICLNHKPWQKHCVEPPCGQFNLANSYIYSVLLGVYQELFNVLSPDEYTHVGGSDVFISCWNSSQEVQNVMWNKGLKTTEIGFLKLWGLYQQNILQLLDKVASLLRMQPKNVIIWSNLLTLPENIPSDILPASRVIIQTREPTDSTTNKELMKKGYKIIDSTSHAWYLNYGADNSKYSNWKNMYNHQILSDENVLGGEVCLWSHVVYDETLDMNIWPRAAAVAERLWSNPLTSSKEAEARLLRHRLRLISRGIKAEAVASEWCYQFEGQC